MKKKYKLFSPLKLSSLKNLKKKSIIGTCNNRIFVLPLTGYVWFGGAKLILNSTLLSGRKRWVSVTVSVTFPFHSLPNQPEEVLLQKQKSLQ